MSVTCCRREGFCHVANVWLRNLETWKPLNHEFSGDAPVAGSAGKTDAAAPVTGKAAGVASTTFMPCVDTADRSAAIDFPAQRATIANVNRSAIFFLIPPDISARCASVS